LSPTPPIELYSETYGSGDPVFCVHGFGATLFTWRNFIAPLSQDHELILIDLKGAGKSPKPPDRFYSTQDHANLLYDFLMKRNLRNLTPVGNSFGGALVLLLTIMLMERGQADRLRSLVLIDAGAYPEYIPRHVKIFSIPLLGWLAIKLAPPRWAVKSILKIAYFDNKKITEEQIATYAASIAAPGGCHALLETGRQIIPQNFDQLIHKCGDLKLPVLIIWGKQDKVIPLVVGEMLDRALPNSVLKVIDRCGHAPQEEQPEQTIALVRDFLGRL
jgi:pimeloyl-ACP methyl ester carboxylesterase